MDISVLDHLIIISEGKYYCPNDESFLYGASINYLFETIIYLSL